VSCKEGEEERKAQGRGGEGGEREGEEERGRYLTRTLFSTLEEAIMKIECALLPYMSQ
jgi:hypothetical protein